MTNRRVLLGSAGAALAHMLLPRAHAANSVVFQHDLPDVNLNGWSVTAVEVTYPPGGGSTAHRHPGITLVCMLEGEIRSHPENTSAASCAMGIGPLVRRLPGI